MARRSSWRRSSYDEGEPYRPLSRPRGSDVPTGKRGGWWVGGEWIEAPSEDQRNRLLPIVIKDRGDSDCFEVPPPAPVARHSRENVEVFDFNDSRQGVPWAAAISQGGRCEPRSFADSADDELLSYLANRSISRGFLVEIDQFFHSHPEVADCTEGREIIRRLNSSSPLEAYRYFLRGYTRPARYVDGIIKSEYFTVPAYQPLRTKFDPELVDFFEGFVYRWDIIDRIDLAVRGAIQEQERGQPMSSSWRRLICYAVWGNPSDAYKWYEYHLQDDYLPHRYLPEHVVLGHLPGLAGDAEAQPCCLKTSRRHMQVRYRMAKANDEGIDVLNVLMTEFRATLVRRGFRRVDIDDMYERGKYQLEDERRYPTGIDIVDLIMDRIPAHRPARRMYMKTSQYTRAVPKKFSFNVTSSRSTRRRKAHRAKATNVPPGLRAQASELRSAKSNLDRAYAQEQSIQSFSSQSTQIAITYSAVTSARARAERRYVNCLICYLRATNRMSTVEARQMQGNFTKKKMEKSGMSNSAGLLGMYPHELK